MSLEMPSRWSTRMIVWSAAILAAIVAQSLRAADSPSAVVKDEPGLTLTIACDGQKSSVPDVRDARLLSLYVAAGAAPSSLGVPGPFTATFEGDINMRLRDFLIFSAQGRGSLSMTLNGNPALEVNGDLASKASESLRLGKGKNHIVLVYKSPADGDASMRIFWATKTGYPEPISPLVLTHSPDKSLQADRQIRAGRLLAAQLRCVKCHAAAELAASKDAMPELAMDAPSLKDAGARLTQGWMAAWISNPKAVRPTAHMPRLFAGDGVAAEARDIAAYLSTLGKPAAPSASSGNVEAGATLFTWLNCLACHVPPGRAADPTAADSAGRIVLDHVAGKFQPGALKAFLLNPSEHYAWISMPNFRLSAAEAENLAAFLSQGSKSTFAAAPGDAANGQKLVASAGCLNCHTIDQPAGASHSTAPGLASLSGAAWQRGCMSASPDAGRHVPNFALTETQRSAILAFATASVSLLAHDTPAEFSQRQIANLRCAACHARDGHESLLALDLDAELQELHTKHPPSGGMEGLSPDQRAPMLTWAGEKLRPQWMASFISGQVPYKPRYYLRARMPGFATHGAMLAAGLAAEHGCAPAYPDYPAPDAKLADIGQTLVGKAQNASFSCVQCHAIAKQPALAPFEAPAINFVHVTDRIREDYYYRWLHDPLRVDPESKMPKFEDIDRKTGLPVFENDATKQYGAIWQYLLRGKDMTPPAPAQ